jgi:signal transduction histidine kinase
VNVVLDRLAALMETTRQITIDAAHDLKTPMTRLLHRLAEAEGNSAAEAKAVLRSAASDAKQIITTFDALLRIAEIEAGARRARFDLVNLSDVVETVADAYGPELEQAGQRLETKIGPNLYVTGDRELLTQAFADLVENAIRHAGKGAAICLMALRHAAAVEAMVSDTGRACRKPIANACCRASSAWKQAGPRRAPVSGSRSSRRSRTCTMRVSSYPTTDRACG